MVIDQQQIREQLWLSSDPADLLAKYVPGFSVSNQNISGASETLRGRSVLVLVDGVPRNTPLRDVSRIISLIDLNSIERIEVVNGPSSIYGAGATGGIVNFITKEAGDDPLQMTTSDRGIDYGRVLSVLGEVGQAGFARVSLIAEAQSPSSAR